MKTLKDRIDTALCKMDSIVQSRLFLLLCVAIFSAIGGLYGYGLISTVRPTAEECLQTGSIYMNDIKNGGVVFSGSLDRLLNTLAYCIFGLSYKTVYIFHTFRYLFILVPLCMALFLLKKEGELGIYSFPIYFLFVVEFKRISENSEFGFFEGKNDIMASEPFVYHFKPLAWALFCIFILEVINSCNKKKQKNIMYVVLGICIILAMKTSDLIYYALFLFPLIAVIFRQLINNRIVQKITIAVSIVVCLFFTVTKFYISSPVCQAIWTNDIGNRYGAVYGITSFAPSNHFSNNIDNVIRFLLDYFNIDRSFSSFLSMWSFVSLIRLVLLIIGIILVFDIVKNTITDSIGNTGYDIIDQVCALGITILMICKLISWYNIQLDDY